MSEMWKTKQQPQRGFVRGMSVTVPQKDHSPYSPRRDGGCEALQACPLNFRLLL